jgi:hypothetical protein
VCILGIRLGLQQTFLFFQIPPVGADPSPMNVSHPGCIAARTLAAGVNVQASGLVGPRGMALAGLGLFASNEYPKIDKGDFITEFDGAYVTGAEYLELEKKVEIIISTLRSLSVSHIHNDV